MAFILAIDPGINGALALYDPAVPDRVSVYDMPTIENRINHHQLYHMLRTWAPERAFIEAVHSMPRDGARQAFAFGSAFTSACVVVSLREIPITYVTPHAWKKVMKIGGGPAGKEECRALALQLFPACAASFARKKDHGRAEAALLAVYAAKLGTQGR